MYFGGQAFVIIINSLSPDFMRMSNTLPERYELVTPSFLLEHRLRYISSAGITTQGLIGFVLFICLYFPIIYWVPAWRVQKLLEVQIVIAAATLLGIMGWAISVSTSSTSHFCRGFHFCRGLKSDISTGQWWKSR